MRQQGIVEDWNDERGFGFIAPSAGGSRVFVHISAFPRARRPATNDLVSYDIARGERDRLRASDVRYVAPPRSRRTGTPGLASALAAATAFLALVAVLAVVDRIPALLVVAYVLLSLAALATYRADKSAARSGQWRVSEATLHTIALLGGWPGALVARPAFRHKTRKQPFRAIFWGTVITNCAVLAWLVYAKPAWPAWLTWPA